MVGNGCGGDGFCGRFWVAGFHVVLCLVVLGFCGRLCEFVGLVVWVDLLGFCGKEEVRKKLISK